MNNISDIRSNYKEQFGFNVDIKNIFETKRGLSEESVRKLSELKGEPQWMLDFRLKALDIFFKKAMPTWGADLKDIDFNDIVYYRKQIKNEANTWEELPKEIKNTFDRLGIPEAERKFLAGVEAQFDSEVVYSKIRKDLDDLGVIFCSTDIALKEHEKLFKRYFSTVVPASDNKFAALNGAFWSGGSFVYIPEGVDVKIPLQAYFRINSKSLGQFERTLIIINKGAKAHYVEGCFTKGAPVVTSQGTKNVEDVRIGDVVLTHNLSYKRVYDTQKRNHNGTLCTIKYVGDTRQEIKITGGHPVLAVKRQKNEYKNTEWTPSWTEAENLEKHDYVALPIDRTVISKDEKFFTIKLSKNGREPKDIDVNIKTDKDFYRLVGYYMAEGSVSSDHYLTFIFNKNERDYIEDVKNLLEKYFGKMPLENKEYKNGI